MVAIFNMRDVEGSTAVVEAMDPGREAGFVVPPGRGRGPAGSLGAGYSEAHAHVMGHYVFVRWAQRRDGATPGRDSAGGVADANVALTDVQAAIRERLYAAN